MVEHAPSLAGKVCIVTGATSGIGASMAGALARLGATVVLVGRHASRCTRQREAIRREAGAAVESMVADLSSQAQIRRLAEDFRATFPRLDVLVNNAGSYFMRRQLTVDGLEMTFALNHLAGFLLTNLLLDRLGASPAARVINVSSIAHERAKLVLDDLQGERHYDRLEAYSTSKLANLLFTYELARRLEGTRTTVNAFHPGTVATNLGRDSGWIRVKLRNLVKGRSMISPEEGARTGVYLASSPDVEGVTGRYFYRSREIRSSEASRDPVSAAALWRISEQLVGLAGVAGRGAGSSRDGHAARPR